MHTCHDHVVINTNISEPSQEGVIPPEFRTSFQSRDQPKSFSPEHDRGSDRKTHNWSNNPVEMWSKEQVNCKIFDNIKLIKIPTF